MLCTYPMKDGQCSPLEYFVKKPKNSNDNFNILSYLPKLKKKFCWKKIFIDSKVSDIWSSKYLKNCYFWKPLQIWKINQLTTSTTKQFSFFEFFIGLILFFFSWFSCKKFPSWNLCNPKWPRTCRFGQQTTWICLSLKNLQLGLHACRHSVKLCSRTVYPFILMGPKPF